MIRFSDILDQLHTYLPDADTGLLEKAYVYSAKVHAGQKRLSGEPYLSHPLEVGHILAQMKLDTASIAAGLLHDTIEDTLTTMEDLKDMFGEDVALIVDGVTKLSKIHFETKLQKQAENIRKMILAMSRDIRVILVKLADRLHNMRTLEHQKPEKQILIARETMDIYAPLASRLGIDWIKRELEDLSFMYLYPVEYRELKETIEQKLGQKKTYLEEIKDFLARKMGEYGFSCKVLGRPKHLYSIFRKMQQRQLPLDQIYDLIAFRIILKNTKECYEALGIVHSLWKPIPGRFKDYISLPKANGYQSLHTTVIGPDGDRMEIQIRTEEMDLVAREGIAAHWLYKEGNIVTKEKQKAFGWLEQLMEWQQELHDPKEFMESVKMDLFPNAIWVFTPKGDVKELPKGATPVDFAYAIHTDIGHHCAGARVNGQLVPLKHELQNGDIIDIITSPHHKPSRDWLKFVKTSKAVTRIHNWLKQEEKEKSIAIGKEICSKEFRKHRLDINDVLKRQWDELSKAFSSVSVKTPEDLFMAIGTGKLSAAQVVKKLLKEGSTDSREQTAAATTDLQDTGHEGVEGLVSAKATKEKATNAVIIDGVDDVMTHLGRCCNPLPNDEIIGYITRGRGLTIHRTTCPNVRNMDPDRKIDVSWSSVKNKAQKYPARIIVVTRDKQGMLATISNAISATNTNILDGRVTTNPDQTAVFHFLLEITDNSHLQNLFAAIKKCDGVIRVMRASK